jgi:hypothetical protein
MADFIRWLGGLRVDNLADFGVLADTVEVTLALIMIVGGIFLTHRVQVWADKAGGEHPGVVNRGQGGAADRYERRTMRD